MEDLRIRAFASSSIERHVAAIKGFHRFCVREGLSKAVRREFVQLYNEGLIYQGERIINWDPVAQTALSNIEVIHKDTKGAMYLTRRYLPLMMERGVGHICNVTSSAGMLALPKMSLYAASKWAAIGWSESLRIELDREKSPVKVTTIAPYFINTGMFDGIHSFFKIQKPETVARKTIWAIQHNVGYRGIPFSSHFIRLMQGIFPYRLFNWAFGDLCGLYTVMDHFTGRKK